MKKKPSFYRFQGHRPNAKSLLAKNLADGKDLCNLFGLQKIWARGPLKFFVAQIFGN